MAEKIKNRSQVGLQIVPREYFDSLRSHIRTMTGPGKPSKHAEHGFAQACLRWLTYARLRLQPMLLLVKWERIMRLALLPMPQVKRWQLHMFLLILLVLQIMPCRLSIEPPTPLMLMLP